MAGFKYWGGLTDLQGKLREKQFPVYTATVGPVSSNWDRACDFYAFLKGGRVDYGEAHSATYGHSRYGRTYDGVLPLWGQSDEAAKIHIVGHSLGSQTARVVATLLNEGSIEERNISGESVSPLFAGGTDWLFSVTTLSGDHDGSTVAVNQTPALHHIESILITGMADQDEINRSQTLYDFKLDQWGLVRETGESHKAFHERVRESHVWLKPDFSLHDGTPDGALALNAWLSAQPHVYYFSWSTRATEKNGDSYSVRWDTNPLLRGFANDMIGLIRDEPGKVPLDESWWPNDGMVNTRSQAGPTLGSSDRVVHLKGKQLDSYEPGLWYHMNTKEGWDHLDIIGIGTERDFVGFYEAWMNHLQTLERSKHQLN
jgi:triacylglycerol lipase